MNSPCEYDTHTHNVNYIKLHVIKVYFNFVVVDFKLTKKSLEVVATKMTPFLLPDAQSDTPHSAAFTRRISNSIKAYS